MIDQDLIKSTIRTISDYPQPGILFRDITTLLQNRRAYNAVVEEIAEKWFDRRIDKIVCLEARGFIFGGAVANILRAGFIPVRKKGKLPYDTTSVSYQLEYGTGDLEIHVDAIEPGERIVIVDDLIATGGTIEASYRLVNRLGGKVIGVSAVIDLPDLGGSKKLSESGIDVHTLVSFPGH
jgi:adenine phosphoribosyltransferase